MKATINDVARRAGVSKATVSRVINGHQNVARILRERVICSIQELEYQPSAVARDLSIGRTRLLGALFSDVSDARSARLLRGMEDRASEQGYLIVLRNTDGQSLREQESIVRLLGQNVAGIVLATATNSGCDSCAHGGIPFVRCGYARPNDVCDAVSADEAAMARRAVHYLMALGHAKICYIGKAAGGREDQREAGYRATMEQNGLTPAVADSGLDYENVMNAVARALETYAPSALIAAEDEIAYAALDALRSRAIFVPEDVSLLSLGGVRCEDKRRQFLTTVSIPAHEIGRNAVDLLLDRINGKNGKPEQRTLRSVLEIRASCALARQELREWQDAKEK